jgi:hypothetical protein
MPVFETVMVRQSKGDSPWGSPEAYVYSTDAERFINKVARLEAQGYVELEDIEATRNMLRRMKKSRELRTTGVYVETTKSGNKKVTRTPYDPATRANRGPEPSMPKPTRDYRGTKEQATEWVPIRTKW